MSKFDWDDGNRGKCARRVPLEEVEALIEISDKPGPPRPIVLETLA